MKSNEEKLDAMNHPTREEWMAYLYRESSRSERAGLAAHLRACPECAAQLNDWQAARKSLDAWPVPARHGKILPPLQPAFKWAAAAAILLAIGFGLGRFASPGVDPVKLRAAIEPELRRELRQELTQWLHEEIDQAALATLAASGEQTRELLADFAGALETEQAANKTAIYAVLNRLERQRIADYLSLKKDLDTMAVNTDASLRQAEQQLIELAEYRPVTFSHPTPE